MFFHDTLTKTEKEFKPIHRGRINLFVCGPTVQDHFHIGHARTYIFFDAVVKFLRQSGHSVFYLQNITDIDDKIINKAKEENLEPLALAESYLEEYYREMKELKVNSINFYARATLHIDEIISQIERLISSGIAYETEDGVYFEVRKFKDYGELSGQNLDQIMHGVRTDISESKRNPEDFVIWKKMKPGEPYWNSPWGEGRPGWHIEDTAITESYFGEEYDIHGAGSDLIFPHHEAENAIARSLSGRKHLARYWLHTGMLNINSEKMSKSLKNFRTIAEILKHYSPEVLRYAMLNANYRTMLDFSEEMMDSSSDNVDYINKVYRKLKKIKTADGKFKLDFESQKTSFEKTMSEDFDTRGLIMKLLDLSSLVNRNLEDISEQVAASIVDLFDWADGILGVIEEEKQIVGESLIESVLDIRRELRKKKEFELSDRIRAELKANGIYIEDINDETEWWFD